MAIHEHPTCDIEEALFQCGTDLHISHGGCKREALHEISWDTAAFHRSSKRYRTLEFMEVRRSIALID